MQIELTMKPLDNSPQSFDYLYALHSLIMENLTKHNRKLAHELHDGLHKNRLKLFTFSPLNSAPSPQLVDGGEGKRKQLLLGERVWWRIASPWPELSHGIAESLLTAGTIALLNKKFQITGAQLIAPPEFKDEMVWRPFGQSGSICTIWTEKENGKSLPVYPDFTGTPSCQKLIADNLIHKFQRLNEIRPDISSAWLKDADIDSIKTVPVSVSFIESAPGRAYKTMRHICKNVPIQSWRCPVSIKAPLPIQRLIWDCGLGSKNSQGYGLVQEGRQ